MNIRDYKYCWGGEDWDLFNCVMMLYVEVEWIRYLGFYYYYYVK